MKLYIGCKVDYHSFLATAACVTFKHLSISRSKRLFHCDSQKKNFSIRPSPYLESRFGHLYSHFDVYCCSCGAICH